MSTLILLIQNYGYAFIFLLTLLEGETVVVLAGFVAYQGYLQLPLVILVAFTGALIGDQSFFYFGKYKGQQFIAARPKLAARAKRVHRLVEHHQNWLMFGSRFMYGFRTILPITMGTSNIERGKYFIFDACGAITWSVLFSIGGYVLGNAVERFIVHVHRAEKFIVIGVLVGVLIAQGVSFLYRRIGAKIEEEERRAEESSSNNSL